MSRNQVIHTADEIARIRRAAQLTAQVRDSVAIGETRNDYF